MCKANVYTSQTYKVPFLVKQVFSRKTFMPDSYYDVQIT